MDSKAHFRKWEPIDNLSRTLYLEGLHDDYEGFRLLLQNNDSKKVLRITFECALSYRNIDEGDLLKTIHNNKELGGWTLFTVENSDYLRWFNEESCDIHEGDCIVHYAIYTPNDCVDILSAYLPIVEWLNCVGTNKYPNISENPEIKKSDLLNSSK